MATVELVYDGDCPNISDTRGNLIRALTNTKQPVRWTEWERSNPETPDRVKGYGSPAVLIDGKDVANFESIGDSPCCRRYGDTGVPPVALIEQAVIGEGKTIWKRILPALPGIAFAFMPKLICPACWPAYAGVLSSLGLGFLGETRYLLPLTGAFLAVALISLGFRARNRWGFGPLWIGVAASVLILGGKFGLDSNAILYFGVAALIGACVWNVWPKSKATFGSCPACVPETGASQIGMDAEEEM